MEASDVVPNPFLGVSGRWSRSNGSWAKPVSRSAGRVWMGELEAPATAPGGGVAAGAQAPSKPASRAPAAPRVADRAMGGNVMGSGFLCAGCAPCDYAAASARW